MKGAALLLLAAAAPSAAIWQGPAMNNWREVEQLNLSGTIKAGLFYPTALAPEQKATPPVPLLLPIGVDILPLARVRPFGAEERVTVERASSGLRIACRAGLAPAGIVLRWPTRRFPRAFRGLWRLAGQSDAPIGLSAVGIGQDAPAIPAARWSDGAISIPFTDREEQMLVLVCPTNNTSAQLNAVTLASEGGVADARGTWIWREQDWRPDPAAFARRASRAGWTELAIQAPDDPDAALARLAEALQERGIGFRLVDGDPAMATSAGRAQAVRRFARLRGWCDDHLAARPQLELDIEPYTLPGFASDPMGWQGWAQSVQAIAQGWGGPVAVDVPWWMRRSPEGAAALRNALPSIGEIIVMAYRTDPQLILDAAESWLGDDGPPVRIAIETGPVAQEVTRLYRRASSGTLRLDDAGAQLFPAPRSAGPNAAMFALIGESRTNPARISFHGKPSRAAEAEKTLAPLLSGWRGFAGFRVHGWEASTNG